MFAESGLGLLEYVTEHTPSNLCIIIFYELICIDLLSIQAWLRGLIDIAQLGDNQLVDLLLLLVCKDICRFTGLAI